MEQFKLYFLFCLFIAGILSCDKNQDPDNDCIDIIVDEDQYDNGIQDQTTVINEITVLDDCLVISLSYSGGCEDHDIKLATDGQETFSTPPIMNFKLLHENTDPCEAYLTEDWSYDLNSLNIVDRIIELKIEGYTTNIVFDFD